MPYSKYGHDQPLTARLWFLVDCLKSLIMKCLFFVIGSHGQYRPINRKGWTFMIALATRSQVY